MEQGLFITFEGPECCGKTTQMRLLQQWLEEQGYEVVRTKEPGGSLVGPEIRRILLTPGIVLTPVQELLLLYADRNGNIHQVILPALERGAIVLCDRFFDCTVAYQHYGRGVPMEQLAAIHDVAVGSLVPHLTIIYDIDADEVARRVAARQRVDSVAVAEARFDNEAHEFHRRVRAGYHEMARREPARFRTLDGGESIERLQLQTRELVAEYLSRCATKGGEPATSPSSLPL